METLNRYDVYICDCPLGPHIETAEAVDGQWVRFDEATAEIERLRADFDASEKEEGLEYERAERYKADFKRVADRLTEATTLLVSWLETADDQEWNASPYEDTETFVKNQSAAPTFAHPGAEEVFQGLRARRMPTQAKTVQDLAAMGFEPHGRLPDAAAGQPYYDPTTCQKECAEQAVLGAMRDVPVSTLQNFATDCSPIFRESSWRLPAIAELARRGLK